MAEQNPAFRSPFYDTHAPPISLKYLLSPFNPYGMPFLHFSSAHRDAVARAFESSRSHAGSEFRDGLSCLGGSGVYSSGANIPGSEDGTAIVRAAIAASLT